VKTRNKITFPQPYRIFIFYLNSRVNNTLSGERLNYSLCLKDKESMATLVLLLFNMVWGTIVHAIRQEKETRHIVCERSICIFTDDTTVFIYL
jgi:hypothetical protein